MHRLNPRLAFFVLAIIVAATHGFAARADDSSAVIRAAKSADGLDFTPDRNDLFRGFEPNLIVLANGDWLLIFRAFDEEIPTSTAELMMSTSRDEGRTWTAPRRSQVIGKRGIRRPGNFTLAALPDGTLRMMYARVGRRPDSVPRHDGTTLDLGRADRTKWTLRIADSRKGLFFRDVGRAGALGTFDSEPRAATFIQDGKLHLLAAEPGTGGNRLAVRHGVVGGERELVRLADAEVQQGAAFTSVVATDKGFRSYADSAEGVVSWSSTDGRDWSRDKAIRLAGATSPTVIRKRHGSYLMLYVEERLALPSRAREEAVAAHVHETSAQVDDSQELDDSPNVIIVDPAPDDPTALSIDPSDPDDPADQLEVPTGNETLAFIDPDDSEEPLGASSLPGFAPLPNFENPVDYIAWYRSASTSKAAAGENAYDAYAKIFADWRKEAAGEADWPEFHDMLNDAPGNTIPGPWDPDRHPEWVKSHAEVADMLKQFQEASRIVRYVPPMEFRDIQTGDGTERLLIDLALPGLFHHRALGRALLADAWRLRNGRTDNQRMIEALRTVLRNSRHLQGGMTLIEELVGLSQQRLAERNALAMLNHGLVSPELMRSMATVLRELDLANREPLESLRGEHAMAMSISQYLFSPAQNGIPVTNLERVEQLRQQGDWANVPELNMNAEEIFASIRAFDEFYRRVGELMTIGYPLVRKADLTALWEEY